MSHAVTQNQKTGWSGVRRSPSIYLFAANHVQAVCLILPLANEGTGWGWVGLSHLSIRTARFDCALVLASLTTAGSPGENLSSTKQVTTECASDLWPFSFQFTSFFPPHLPTCSFPSSFYNFPNQQVRRQDTSKQRWEVKELSFWTD